MAETRDLPSPDAPDPERPRKRLRALTGLALLGTLAVAIWQLAYWEPRLLPVRVIDVQGELHHHSSELLQKTIGERLSGGFLTADLWELKRAAEDLAWVGGASIRRIWPDRLQVHVEEHRPVAHWNGDGLVTAAGLVFRPRGGPAPVGLPFLEGPDGRAPEVAARYLKWRDDLMLAGHLIQTLALDPRGSWRLDLVSGPRLELGTEQVEQRLARFIAASTQLEAAGVPQVVDLRYANGFAVKWRPSAPAAPESAASGAPALAGSGVPKALPTKVGPSKATARKGATGKRSAPKGAAAKSGGSKASVAKSAAPKTGQGKAAKPRTETGTANGKARAKAGAESGAPRAPAQRG